MTDPFAAYRPKSDAQPVLEQETDPFSAYRPKQQEISQEKPESLIGNIGRQAGRTGARVAETALGAPRAFGEFLQGLVPEKALIKGAEKVGLGKGAKNLLETTKKYAPYKIFPSSGQVKDFNRSLFGKKVEPQNEWEKKADEVVSDFAALALPLPGSKVKLLKPALLSLGGNIASGLVEKMGGSEKQQTYTKLGTFLLGSLYNRKGAEKFRNDLYAKARENRPADAKVGVTNLQNKINKFRTDLMKGDPNSPSKKKSFDLLKGIESKIQGNDIPVEELEKFKIDINEARGALYDEFKGNKPGRKLAKANLDNVSKIVDNTLTEYGKINPAWEAYYRPANEAHGAIAQSQKVRNFIGNNLGKLAPHLTLGLFGIEKAAGLGPTATSLAGGYTALETGELLSRIYKSPTLRKYYMGVVKNALKEDAVAMRENLRKLEEELGEKD